MTPARASGVYPVAGVIGAAGIAAAVIVAAALLAFAAVNWPSADDFCNTVLVRSGGLSGAMHWLYTQWSGRVLTGVVLYSTFALVDIPSLQLVSIVLTVLFIACAWRLVAFVAPAAATLRHALFGFVLAALMIGLYPLLGQTVFWPTGGIVYLLPLLLLVHWLEGMHHLVHDAPPAPNNVYGFAISVAVGNSIELVVPIALCYAVAVAALRSASMTREVRRAWLVRVAGIALGAACLVSAPGNFLRGAATPGSFDLSPPVLAHEYARVTRAALHAGLVVVAIAAAMALVGALLRVRQRGRQAPAPHRLGEALALVIGGFASLLPVLAAPAQFSPRNGLYLLICLFAAGLIVLVQALERRETHMAAASLSAAAIVAAVIGAHRVAADYELARLRRDQQLARDAFLRDPGHRGQEVTVKPIRPYPPPTLHAIDITSDNLQIVNQCVARYYDLASVELARDTSAP